MVRQKISNLETGGLYSLRMYSGYCGALVESASRKEKHPVSVGIAGAKMLEGTRMSYQELLPTRGDVLGFTREKPPWLNYHWQVLRAEGPIAEIRITDWESPDEAGSPRVESVLCTYVEIKPFMEEDG